jgi:DNA-binding GntR family transcriptional regulator
VRLPVTIGAFARDPLLRARDALREAARAPSLKKACAGSAQATIGEHNRIIDAIERHDADQAEQLVRAHMQ